ncbi:MAG: hypothetical protein ACE5GG_01550, partial [Candidatus Omnitrophota bacterium]
MATRHRTFRGGYRFRRFEKYPDNSLTEQALPRRVIIPLAQGFGREVKPLVRAGERVRAGQIIGRDDENISSPVHSSLCGVVEEIKRLNYFKRDVLMAVIRCEGEDHSPLLVEGHNPSWERLSPRQIEKALYLAGVTALDREGIPTSFRSSIIAPDEVEDIIVHGVGSEPYNVSLDVLLAGRKVLDLITGLKILHRMIPRARLHLAINSRAKKICEEINKISSRYDWLDVCLLDPKYPQGYDEMLVPTILNKKFPFGYSAANIGVVVLNVQAVISVYQAVVEGRPLIERTIAVCGPGIEHPTHIKARIGTPLAEIIEPRLSRRFRREDTRIVLNSLLTGARLTDLSLPLSKTFSQIIALPENRRREFLAFLRWGARRQSFSHTFASRLFPFRDKRAETNLHGEQRPCISCNYCEQVCPVDVIPHLLSKYVT